MPRNRRDTARLDAPKGLKQSVIPLVGGRRHSDRRSSDRFGRFTESIARAMGTPWFLLGLTLFCAAWMAYNVLAPEQARFDSAAIGFTALTLILSLQASYAAPLILLAQNRQDDRDRVSMEQDRQRTERNLSDTEYLAREVVALRLALENAPSKEFMRQELRSLLDELNRKETDRREGDRHESGEPDRSA